MLYVMDLGWEKENKLLWIWVEIYFGVKVINV